MLNLTLRQLSIFVAIARLGSVTQASKQLFMTQSAASMALAELEQVMGKPLFERVHKTLRLNHIGELLLPKAITILEQAEALAYVGNAKDLHGTLRIAASSTIGNYVLPHYFGQFQQQYPGVQIISRIANTETIIRSLLQYETDVGFIEGYCHEPALKTHPWLTDELCLCVGPTHPLASKKRIDDTDLAETSWILREPGSGTREVFEHAIRDRVSQLKIIMELSSGEAIKAVVRQGMGVSCLSRHLIQDDLSKGSLVNLKVDLALQRQYSWLVPPQRLASPLVNAWFDLLNG